MNHLNQLFELRFPLFQKLHHSETRDMGCFLKTNLERKYYQGKPAEGKKNSKNHLFKSSCPQGI